MRVKYLPVVEGQRLGIDKFPNFSATGSVRGMKRDFYGKDALLVRCGSYIYCVSQNFWDWALGQTIYSRAH